MKRTELKRGKRLKRRAPLRRVSEKRQAQPERVRARRGSMTAAVALALAGEATVAQAARECEVDPERLDKRAWDAAKAIVMEFASWTCRACGQLARDVHHRVRRGIGGTADPVIAFGRVNLVALCRRCHDLCHREDPEMRRRGFQLRTTDDPVRIPIEAAAEFGGRQVLWLLPNGETADTAPYEEVAA